MKYISIKDIDLNEKTIILRADLNVPLQNGKITNFTRIDRLKKTIDYLRRNNNKILIISHFGRPKGQINLDFSLKFIVETLKNRWNCEISFGNDVINPSERENLENNSIKLLENVRFYKEEEENSKNFAKKLAYGADLYVNDAFSVSHRAHASTEAITHILPSACGLLMAEELSSLNKVLENPKKPLAAIIGGSKISTKIDLLNNLVKKVDLLILGGGMANSFAYAKGGNVGNSLCEKNLKPTILRILKTASKNNCKIILPIDGLGSKEFKATPETYEIDANNIKDDLMMLDIGTKTIDLIKKEIKDIKTLIWNGPLGAFELTPFDSGTNSLAKIVAEKTKSGDIISVAGGGDTASALENAGVTNDFTYISTAGGAFLEWLEGKNLPAIKALSKK